MTTLKEITISSIGEPACVKIEKNSKGYNVEVSLHSETLDEAVKQTVAAMVRVRAELGDTGGA